MIPPVLMPLFATIIIVCNLTLPPEPKPSPDLVEMLACGIYNEAGGDACSDDTRRYVGDVMLNRVEDSRFPDTLEKVLTAPGQYGRFSTTGIVWPDRAKNPGEKHAVERAYRIAEELLSGQHSELYGQGYVWQAEFEQGTEGFWQDGLFFWKVISPLSERAAQRGAWSTSFHLEKRLGEDAAGGVRVPETRRSCR